MKTRLLPLAAALLCLALALSAMPARAEEASLFRYPFFSSAVRCECTEDEDFRPVASPISRTLGGQPLSRIEMRM